MATWHKTYKPVYFVLKEKKIVMCIKVVLNKPKQSEYFQLGSVKSFTGCGRTI